MGALVEFLARNTIDKNLPLPLVHSCQAYFIKQIMASGQLKASPCNVFQGEDLLYFFVGRPAYKYELELQPKYWELPICFILQYDVSTAKRIYPFDTGAFKSGRLPKYVTIADLHEFDVSVDREAVCKIIGTFFSSRFNYYRTKPRSESEFLERYGVDILDTEVRSIHSLITDGMPYKSDDRRATIEVSLPHAVKLTSDRVLAVVIPERYLDCEIIMNYIQSDLRADVLSYPEYSQNVEFYYSFIYQKVEAFFREQGYLDV
jgi:hypothetical protein